MPDRKMVIKGLKCIVDGDVRCECCGYAIDKHGHHSCQQNCASDAITLLKEQEPQKVINRYVNWNAVLMGNCPKCNAVLHEFDNAKACGVCGQAVKWE